MPSMYSRIDRKSTRLNSSHLGISYAVFCLKKKKNIFTPTVLRVPAMRRSAAVAERPALGLAPVVSPAPPGQMIVDGLAKIFFFFFLMKGPPPRSTLFPYPPLSR